MAAEIPDGPVRHVPMMLACAALGILLALVPVGTTTAQDEPDDPAQPFATPEDIQRLELPVIDRSPFDRLYFDEERVPMLEINPLELEGVDVNAPVDVSGRTGRVVFSIPGYPNRLFASAWSAVTRVERYVEIVMNEARLAMERQDYGTAFRTLTFLLEHSPERKAEVDRMLDQCLYEDAMQRREAGEFGDALAAFEELYRRNPRYPTGGAGSILDNIISVYEQFVQREFDAGMFYSVRELLSGMRARYGDRGEEVAARWEGRMRDAALARLDDVRAAMDAGNALEAHIAAREVLYVMPDLPNARIAFNAVINRFPMVMVGVTQPAADASTLSIENWGSRRVGRLLKRSIIEFQRPGDDGGIYRFPAGRFLQADDLGYRYRFILDLEERAGLPPLTAYDLSNRLMDLADEESPDYYIPWARMVAGIEIENERQVVIRLRYPHVRPESIMPLEWFSPGDPRRNEPFGLYRLAESRENLSIYEFNDRYQRPAGQFPVVVERVYKDMSQSSDALLRGEVDIIDRVMAVDIDRLRRDPMIEVRPYLIPLVHMLIPNPRNEFIRNDQFRRALQFGINRELIVKELLTFGRELEGFQLVSGPFPPGTDTADQLSYAYNTEVAPRQHDLKLALVLVQKFITDRQRFLIAKGNPDAVVEIPELVIAHPDSDLVAAACQIIEQQWRAAGIPSVRLRRLPPGVVVPEDDDYDFLYCEVQFREPLVDAYRVFGKGGLCKISDPTTDQALRQLDSAFSWAEVSRSLRRVHRQAYANLTILPLWQTVEYCAWRRNLSNVGDRLIDVYQNVEHWQIEGPGSIDFSATQPARNP